MSLHLNRRQFVGTVAVTGAGYWIAGNSLAAEPKSANEKLNIACIGCGGQGGGHVSRAAGQNLVALCDVDEKRAGSAFEKHPQARRFHDFRKMFDELEKQIDAVYVATPDHTHAPASVMAMRLGKHVYCEKPLAHSVHECRVMASVAVERKVATQMGNQAHGGSGCRSLVEIVRSGAIGKVREAHAWCPKNFSASSRPAERPEIPSTLQWNLWLGPAPERPYHPTYLPFNWRGWADFGTGGLGDMACHIVDPIFWSLELAHPATVEAAGEPRENPEGFARDLTVKYEFASRGSELYHAPVTVYWHHGNNVPQKKPVPGVEIPEDVKLPGEGVMFVGEKGVIIGDRGPGLIALLPRDKFADFQPPEPTLPRGPGHAEEWMQAIRGGPPALSNFQYGALLTETVLLGNAAWRVGKKLSWDAENMKAVGCPEADAWLRREYREGWTL